MTLATRLLAASLAAVSLSSAALVPDPTGLWYRADEPGTGAAVYQQGETLFVVLFLYDAERRPTWYVASSVRDSGTHLDPIGVPVYSGTLYRTTGSPFALPFDPAASTVSAVGTIELALFTFSGVPPSLNVAYTIQGTRFARALQPQSWESARPRAAGNYLGAPALRPFPPEGCTAEHAARFPRQADLVISPVAADALSIQWSAAGSPTCAIQGPYQQQGQPGARDASCAGPIPRRWSRSARPRCRYIGSVGGVRRP